MQYVCVRVCGGSALYEYSCNAYRLSPIILTPIVYRLFMYLLLLQFGICFFLLLDGKAQLEGCTVLDLVTVNSISVSISISISISTGISISISHSISISVLALVLWYYQWYYNKISLPILKCLLNQIFCWLNFCFTLGID